MAVTHKPKGGALLTGTEYEAADSHVVSIAHTDLTGVTANQHHNQSHTQGDHTGTGSTSTQAFGDAAADGTGTKPANIDHKHGMPANPAPSFATPAIVLGTAAGAGVAATVIRSDATIVAFDATVPTTSAVGDAAATGSAVVSARRDHTHGREAFGASAAAVGTSSGGAATTPSRSDHVHATGAGTPSTQAFGDAATTGTGPAASMTDHKHAWPALGTTAAAIGTSAGGSATTPSKSDHVHAITSTSAFATATTSVSAATYADVTGVTVTLATGTWLVTAQCSGSSVNAQAIMHVAITDAANTVLAEGSQGIGASGTASVAQLGTVTVTAIVVATGAAIKMRAARGLTTITGTWVAMNGAGTNTTNNLTDGSNKGTGIFAVRIA
jgi:hypothetical protein